ncbi:hypothetical protein [Helicobacter pylori]|uniref:hypothetical protein n=1 Tax=Helicobacter pylori TaxID=210 RepID=UPI001FD4D4E6|nr:hypothetical protein [Helicobacter pylori]UOS60895.1 hypothetical protein MPG18_00300 [Helicobacter pylori]
MSVAQSLGLTKRLKGEVTIENYKVVSGLNHNGKQKQVFGRAMILSKSEQDKIDKLRAEVGLIKPRETKPINRIKLINQVIIALSLVGATGLFCCYGFSKEMITFTLLYIIPIIVLACFSIREIWEREIWEKEPADDENYDEVIRFKLSPKQHKYREALEN